MQDDPTKDDSLKAKWDKIYQDICDDLEEATQQDDCLEIGWQRDAYYSDQKLIAHMEGEYDKFDVDLGEFLSDVEDDPDAAEFNLDYEGGFGSELNEIDPDSEESSQDELEDKKHLMPFFSLFAYFISLMVISGLVFFISLFLLYV